jgi:hypothetical protein
MHEKEKVTLDMELHEIRTASFVSSTCGCHSVIDQEMLLTFKV